MSDSLPLRDVPHLPETRVVTFTRLRRERRLPTRGEVSTTIGSKLDPLDVIARAVPPRARRAVSLTRVLGVREADVPKRLLKHVGDTVEPREIIIAKPINFGLQQLVYRAPGAGQIVALQGSWMLFDLDGLPVDLKALYRGMVVSVTPRLGVVIEGQGALIQGVWGSGKEGYGVLKMMARTPSDILQESLDVDVRGTILVAGAGASDEALKRAETLQAQGVIVGSVLAGQRALVEQLSLPVVVTEGFGRVPLAPPIFELLNASNGQEAAVNGLTRARGGAVRPEIFIPRVGTRGSERGAAPEPTALAVQPNARVRVIREPYLGRTGTLPRTLEMRWTTTEGGTRLPSVELELQDTFGSPTTERFVIPWANLELIG